MKSSVTGAVAAMSFGLVYAGLAAEQIAPRMSDSSAAQRDRSLTLMGGTIRSPEEFAIDAQMREANGDEEKLNKLRARRDAILKTGKELEDKIERMTVKPSGS